MRVLFAAVGARPHLYPIVPLAWACRSAGHEVRLASTPALAADLVGTGLPALPLGGPPRHSPSSRQDLANQVYSQDPWPPGWAARLDLLPAKAYAYLQQLGRYMVMAAEAMVDDLVAFARHWRPHLIVHDAVTYAGAVAAAVLGIPNVRHLFGTASVPRLELHPGDGTPLPEYVNLFQRFGVPVREPATSTVDPTPPSMRLATPAGALDMRYVPFNGAGAEPPGLGGRRDRPRVCVTWGHTASGALAAAAADPYRDAIRAIADLPVDLVVVSTAEQIAALGELPAGARALASVPLQLVVSGCDVLVQQGGDGTTLTAAAYGLPQLTITRKPDAELAAAQLARAGAGIHLWYQHLRSDGAPRDVIRSNVERLYTQSSFRDAAGRLRQEIEAAPAPADLVPVLAGLAGEQT
jgi:glycosyltransferase